jgi:SpoVK/Ycf46/Vps4 family AAA+-type ATPase
MNEASPYTDSWEHLLDEIGCLELMLRREAHRFRRLRPDDQPEPFRGLFIYEAEVERSLGCQTEPSGDESDAAWRRSIAERRELIAARRRASQEQGVHLSLSRLAQLFGLTPFEEQLIVICLAPELDSKYGRLYAYLQDDVTRKQPGVELAIRLCAATPHERLRARAAFSRPLPLFKAQLLRYLDGEEPPLPARLLKLDEMVVGYLLEAGGEGREFGACCRSIAAPVDLRRLRWPQNLKTRMVETVREQLRLRPPASRRLIYHLRGPAGTGKRSLAAGVCHALGVRLLEVDIGELWLRAPDFEESLRRLLREALLQPAAVFLHRFDQLLGDEPKSVSHRRDLARAIDDFSWLTFIATESAWEPQGLFSRHFFARVELPAPNIEARAELWAEFTAGQNRFAPDVDWSELAARFRLTPGQMRDALIAARNQALLRGSSPQTPPEATPMIEPRIEPRIEPLIEMDDMVVGCRLQSNQRLSALARKLSPRKGWEDITLPEHAMEQLREICAQVKHRRTVYGEWGFGRKQTLGKGLCVLFYGLSGTGKTLAVEVMARELKLEAFKIDLSTVVSKYIGETEKNLSRVFQEAETGNAILFFDEADALFGKRSEVKDAHDRYANIEIGYLLQRMEEFDGLVILATNLRKNIDEAFFRRMHFAVEFPMPNESHRYRIWKQHLPQSAPVAADIDFDFLSRRVNLAGGNIKSVVVNAAFLAAENSGVIQMKHFLHAVRREYEKIGRLCTDADFAPYHNLLGDRRAGEP